MLRYLASPLASAKLERNSFAKAGERTMELTESEKKRGRVVEEMGEITNPNWK